MQKIEARQFFQNKRKALTQSEITQLYNTSGGTQYPFFTGRTLDISGSNLAATTTNGGYNGMLAVSGLTAKGFTVTKVVAVSIQDESFSTINSTSCFPEYSKTTS